MIKEQTTTRPIVPYTYQEYPRVLYGPESTTVIVNTDDERDAYLSDGFSMKPEMVKDPEIKRRGRPPKQVN